MTIFFSPPYRDPGIHLEFTDYMREWKRIAFRIDLGTVEIQSCGTWVWTVHFKMVLGKSGIKVYCFSS